VPVSSQPEKVMARYRTYSIEFKRQVVREYLAGEVSLHGLAKRHRICRNLIRLWLTKYEAGEFTEEAAVAASLEEYEARIAALERKVGQLTMENDLLKKALPKSRSPNGASSSIVSGPPASPERKDVG
jgi:transposase-like protein